MSEINYQELREIAKKATQGEWSAFISPGTGTYAVHTPGDKRCEDVIKWTGFDGQKNAENNARYIAAFNPEVVLALLDELDKWKQESSAWQSVAEKQLALATNAERKIAELESLAAPQLPQPAVPDEMPQPDTARMFFTDAVVAIAKVQGWNACRAAMLQCSEPVTDNTNQQFESLSRGDK